MFHGTISKDEPMIGKGEFQFFQNMVTGVFREDRINEAYLNLDYEVIEHMKKIAKSVSLDDDSSSSEK